MSKFESSRQNRLRTRLWKCFCYGELDYDIPEGSKGVFSFANTDDAPPGTHVEKSLKTVVDSGACSGITMVVYHSPVEPHCYV